MRTTTLLLVLAACVASANAFVVREKTPAFMMPKFDALNVLSTVHSFQTMQTNRDTPSFDTSLPGCKEAITAAAQCTQNTDISSTDTAKQTAALNTFCSGGCATASVAYIDKCIDATKLNNAQKAAVEKMKQAFNVICAKDSAGNYCAQVLAKIGTTLSNQNPSSPNSQAPTEATMDSVCGECMQKLISLAQFGPEVSQQLNVMCSKDGGKYCLIEVYAIMKLANDKDFQGATARSCANRCFNVWYNFSRRSGDVRRGQLSEDEKFSSAAADSALTDRCLKNAAGRYCNQLTGNNQDTSMATMITACSNIFQAAQSDSTTKPTCSTECKTAAQAVADSMGCCLARMKANADKLAERFPNSSAAARNKKSLSVVTLLKDTCTLTLAEACSDPEKAKRPAKGKIAFKGITKAYYNANKDAFEANFKADTSTATSIPASDISVDGVTESSSALQFMIAQSSSGIKVSYSIASSTGQADTDAAAAALDSQIKAGTLVYPAVTSQAASDNEIVTVDTASSASEQPAAGSSASSLAVNVFFAAVAAVVVAVLF